MRSMSQNVGLPPGPPPPLPPEIAVRYEAERKASALFFKDAGKPGSVPPDPNTIPNLNIFGCRPPTNESLRVVVDGLVKRVKTIERKLK